MLSRLRVPALQHEGGVFSQSFFSMFLFFAMPTAAIVGAARYLSHRRRKRRFLVIYDAAWDPSSPVWRSAKLKAQNEQDARQKAHRRIYGIVYRVQPLDE